MHLTLHAYDAALVCSISFLEFEAHKPISTDLNYLLRIATELISII